MKGGIIGAPITDMVHWAGHHVTHTHEADALNTTHMIMFRAFFWQSKN
jgi:hypothetical protein